MCTRPTAVKGQGHFALASRELPLLAALPTPTTPRPSRAYIYTTISLLSATSTYYIYTHTYTYMYTHTSLEYIILVFLSSPFLLPHRSTP